MNNKIKGKISTFFMLIVLFTQTLTPVVTVFAEDITRGTESSSDVRVETQASETSDNNVNNVVQNDTNSLEASHPTVLSTEITNESTTTEPSTESVVTTVEETTETTEATEEDEEPARESTEATPKAPVSVQSQETVDDILQLLTGVTAKIQINGKWQAFNHQESITIDPEALGGLVLNYEFKNIPNEIELEANTVYAIILPDLVNVSKEVTWQNDEKDITFQITVDGKLNIIFSEEFIKKDQREFAANLNLAIDKTVFEEERYQKVEIGYGDTKIFESEIIGDNNNLEGEDNKKGFTYIKEGDKKTETNIRPTHADWKVTANSGINRYKSAKIQDTIGEGHTLVTDSIVVTKVVRNKVTGKILDREIITLPEGAIQINGQTFTIDMGDIADTYEVSYTTVITEGDPGTKNKIKNNAVIILDGEEIKVQDEIDVSWGETYPPITKTSSSVEGKYINWEINYNYANEDFGVDPLILTDTLSEGSYFEASDLKLVVHEMRLNREGKPEYVADVTKTVTPTINEQGHLVLSIPDSKGKGYKITYHSLLKGGLADGTKIKNEATVNTPDEPTAGAEQVVNTQPSLNKSSNVVYEKGEAYIDWTIVFNKEGYAFDKLTLKDTYNQAYLELLTETVKLNDKPVTVNQTNEGFSLTIEPAEAKSYILTYRTKVTDEGLKNQLTNKVDVDWGNGPGVGTGEVEPGEIKPGMKKEGKYSMVTDENRQKIDWKITFNQNKLILNQPVLTDTFSPTDLEVIGDIVIKSGDQIVDTNEYVYAKTADGFTVHFKGKTEAAVYTIEYSTNAPDATNADSINTVTLEWQGKGDSATVTVPKRTPGVNKSGETVVDEDGKKQNNWKVNFNTNKHVIYDLELTDTFTPVTSTLIDGLAGVTIAKADGTKLKIDQDYKIAFATGKTNQFIVEFLKETEPTAYTMTYSTTYTPIDETENAVNTVELKYRGGTQSANKTVPKPTLTVEKKVTGLNKESDPKILSWQINANPGEAAKNRVSLVNAKLIDAILADQKYVEDSMKIIRADKPNELLDIETHVVWKGPTFTINLPDGPYEYIVTYDTAIVAYPSMNPSKPGKYDRYYNEVLLTNTPIKGQESEEARANAYKDYFDDGSNNNAEKSGEQNPDTDNIDWKVNINPAGLPIREAKIIDTLDQYQEYIEDSVTLSLDDLKLKKGIDYTIDFGENAGNKTFTIVLNERKETPEEVESGISYNYQLAYSTRLRDDAVGIFDVQNEFTISGLVNASWTETITTSTSAEKWTYGGSGSGVTLSFEGKKIDAKRPDVTLEGVKFNLSRITGSNPEIKTPAPGELITDENGTITVKTIRSGRYILEETQAKPGYENIPVIHFILGYDKQGEKLITLTDSNWKAKENPNVSVEDGKLVIRNKQITRAILANKIWSDNSPQQKPTIWFTLFSRIKATKVGGVRIMDSTQELASGKTDVSWDNLPTHNDAGDALEYYVKETDEEGTLLIPEYYEQSGEGLTLTNHFIEKPIDWKATKVWQDYSNKHWTRPETIYLQLLQDGQTYGEIVALSGSKYFDSWEHTFDKLPQVDMITGKAYVYTVQEVNEQGEAIEQLGDYDVTSNGQVITNTLRNVTELSGVKAWDDFDNKDQVRPASVTINLLQNDKKINEITITNDEDWKFSFTDLVKYDEEGNLYHYRVTEEAVPGYTPSIDGTTITNSYRGKVEVAGMKTWEDEDNRFNSRPTTITVQLLQNEELFDEQIIGENEEWHYAFTDLAKYDETGEPYVYTVAEVAVNGYETSIDQTTSVITNRLVTTDVQVNKGWDDFENQYNLRPASIQVRLLQNGEPLESVEPATIKPDEKGNWQHRFINLPKFDSDGKEYQYTIEETAVPGYESTIVQTLEAVEGEIGFNLINQLVTIDLPISKEWSDNNNQYGLRPDSITVRLLQNGKEIEWAPAIELNAENKWQSEFTDLPKFDAAGQPFEYLISEDVVTGYETSIDQTTGVITNQLSTTSLIGEKLWEDWNNQRNQRPESITVHLLQGDQVIETLEVKPDTTGKWHFSFDNLPKVNAQGETFEYSVTEDEVENYRATIEQEGNTVTITNHYFSRLPETGGGKEENGGGKLPNTGGESKKPKPTTPKKSLPQTGEQVNPLLSLVGVLLVVTVITLSVYQYRKQQ